MGMWDELKKNFLALVEPDNNSGRKKAGKKDSDGTDAILKELEEADRRRAEASRLKEKEKMYELGMTDAEIEAYDPAAAAVMPKSGVLKVMVVSDTHGHLENLKKALDAEKPLDMLLHCGDIENDENIIRIMANCHCRMVSGNMDFGNASPATDIFEIGCHKILLCHGHRLSVSSGTDMLCSQARALGAELTFYGHTHMPEISGFGGVTCANPGSIAKPRQSDGRFTYIIMEIDADSSKKPVLTIKDVPDGVSAKFRW